MLTTRPCTFPNSNEDSDHSRQGRKEESTMPSARRSVHPTDSRLLSLNLLKLTRLRVHFILGKTAESRESLKNEKLKLKQRWHLLSEISRDVHCNTWANSKALNKREPPHSMLSEGKKSNNNLARLSWFFWGLCDCCSLSLRCGALMVGSKDYTWVPMCP